MRNTENISLFNKLWNKVRRLWKKDINVYFISGMCYNCKVFDKLVLPEGYRKVYLEWHVPDIDDSLFDYSRKMSENIDTRHPFVLVGYSFGAVIMQEMMKYLSPLESIIISSFKSETEIPTIFRVAKNTQILRRTPLMVYSTEFITKAFNKVIYDLPSSELAVYMTVTDPVYIKWAAIQITEWIPDNVFPVLYHIHGTDDQIFPYEKIGNSHTIIGGDHLMVVKKADEVSKVIGFILLKKK